MIRFRSQALLWLVAAPPLAAQIAISPDSVPGATIGAPYSQNLTASGGTGPYTFAVTAGALPAGLTLSAAAISGTPTGPAGAASFTITATDSVMATGTRAYTIQVADPPQITTLSLPDAFIGISYSQTLTAAGGTAPNSFAITSGSLPPGLTLSGATISGTPTGPAGTSSFTVTITDANSATGNRALTIQVLQPLQITTTALPNATVGAAYSQTMAATGGSGTRTWSVIAGSLPAGLTLDPSTGTISGVPSGTPADYPFTVRVADSTAAPATRALNIRLQAALTISNASPLPGAAEGIAYSQQLNGTGGAGGPYSFLAISTPPAGLSIGPSGLISGTPTVSGNFTFTVQVTDVANAAATKPFDLSIMPRPQIASLSPSSAPAGIGDVALTISGTGFVTGAAVQFGAAALTPGSVSPTQISVTVPAAQLGTPGPVSVTVVNPFPVSSTPAVFTIEAPSISALNPASVPAGSNSFTLTVTGSRFVSASTVNFAGSAMATTFVSNSQLTAQIPASAVTNPGTVPVTVSNTPTATSAAANFSITPRPAITALNPSSISAGAPAFTLQVSGTGFVNGAVVSFNSTALPTLFGSSTQLSAQVPASLIALPGTATITVSLPGGSTSLGAPFTVGSAPVVLTISPQATTAGAPPFTLTVNGSGFVAQSAVQLNGQTLATTFVNSGQLTAAVPASLTAIAGSAILSVVNPGPVNSNAVPLLVNPPTTFITQTLLPAVVGTAYAQAVTMAGGTAPLTYGVSLGALPPGLSLIAANGAITGTPAAPGTFEFTIQVTDAAAFQVSRTFTIAVSRALTIATDAALATGAVGRPYSAPLLAQGGTPPYPAWTLLTGALPPGLALNAATGVISGTPTAQGNYAFVIQVRDAAGQTTQKGFTLVINAGLAIVSVGQLESGTIGAPFSLLLAASGGSPPYTWRIESGALPPGLTLNTATGAVTGSPSAEGTFNFAVEVRDSAGQTARTPLTLTVISTLSITTGAQLPAGTVRASYSARLVAAGGTAPYTGWRVVSGTLPPGLSLIPTTGELTGTPTQAGDFVFTAAVSDAANRTVSKQFALTVNPPGLAITTAAALPGATYGSAYSQTLQADGGIEPYRWAVTSGALPQGLSLGAGTGVLNGSPLGVGPFAFTVTVTDNAARTATREFTLQVAPPAPPAVQIGGPADNAEAATQPRIELTLAQPYPLEMQGTIELTFEPDAVNNADDPAVRFANGTRSIRFRVPANASSALFEGTPAFQTGTVAGTLRFQPRLSASGVALPAPAPRLVRVLRAAPVLRGVQVTRNASGFEVVVTGYSTSREVTQAAFRFTPSSGANLQTTEITIPLSTLAGAWFAGAESRTFGGQFTYRQPFNIAGEQAAVGSVSVQLSNATGGSQPSGANLP